MITAYKTLCFYNYNLDPIGPFAIIKAAQISFLNIFLKEHQLLSRSLKYSPKQNKVNFKKNVAIARNINYNPTILEKQYQARLERHIISPIGHKSSPLLDGSCSQRSQNISLVSNRLIKLIFRST